MSFGLRRDNFATGLPIHHNRAQFSLIFRVYADRKDFAPRSPRGAACDSTVNVNL
jgi:hypothetical protein